MLRFPLPTRGLTVGLLTLLYGMGAYSTALPSDPLVFVGSGSGGGVVGVFLADGPLNGVGLLPLSKTLEMAKKIVELRTRLTVDAINRAMGQ